MRRHHQSKNRYPIRWFALLTLACLLLIGSKLVCASSKIEYVPVFLFGKQMELGSKTYGSPPPFQVKAIIQDGNPYVPVSILAKMAESKDGAILQFAYGSTKVGTARTDGRVRRIIGSDYFPLRIYANLNGYSVTYDKSKQRVVLQLNLKQMRPAISGRGAVEEVAICSGATYGIPIPEALLMSTFGTGPRPKAQYQPFPLVGDYVEGNITYEVTPEYQLQAIDTSTKRLLWAGDNGGERQGCGADALVTTDDTIAVNWGYGPLTCYDKKTGKCLWSEGYPVLDKAGPLITIGSDPKYNLHFYSDSINYFRVLDAHTGIILLEIQKRRMHTEIEGMYHGYLQKDHIVYVAYYDSGVAKMFRVNLASIRRN